ncbi:MAG: L-lactate dehydrogenase [Clostridia bacterium]|nr:L-lactate dehydrogenase [Clostridia bacterium]
MTDINPKKVGVIGCGFVGSATAFSLMQSGLYNEMVLLDADKAKAEGEALDIAHGLPHGGSMKIYAGSYDDLTNCSVVIITAGANQKEGETRRDLASKNLAIYDKILPELSDRNYGGLLLVVSNPVDLLTYSAVKRHGFAPNRVIGSGTVLDTARLRFELSEYLSVDAKSVHAFIVGEHGDSEVAAWSSAVVAGVPLYEFCLLRGRRGDENILSEIASRVKNSAYDIITKKRATYYGIATAVTRICRAIVKDEKSVLPVSTISEKYDVAVGLPSIVGAQGIEMTLPLRLSATEREDFMIGTRELSEMISALGL